MEGIKLIASNKRASYDYFLSSFIEAGISLKGTEIKSLKVNGASLNDSYVIIRNNEAKALKLADLIKCKRTIYETRKPDENNINSKIDVKLILGRDFDGKVVK